MGTNYYAHYKPCHACGHPEERVHIGKSSMGWAFALHIYPDGDGPCSWEEWQDVLSRDDVTIVDEYGYEMPLEEFRPTVEERDPKCRRTDPLFDHFSRPGPPGTTYDYHWGYFS